MNPRIPLCLFAVLVVACAAARAGEFAADKRNHWAWKVPAARNLPTVGDRAWAKNPIDVFILAKLSDAGLTPASASTRSQLLRRVTFDVIGLPPTPHEVNAFERDNLPGAWERVIDRLLSSPHYGERWGRHWLDLARYAESNGFEHDEIRPDAWRYRDYVIRAFNSNKPYDRFIKEQIAGDELYPDEPEALIATGFNLLGPDMTDAASQAQRRQNTLDDMTETTGLAFLGMTIGCAKCHDHKFEPIPQADFFRLQAFFAPALFRKDVPIATIAERNAYADQLGKYQAAISPARAALTTLEAPYRQKLYDMRLARLADEARRAHETSAEKRTAAQKELVDKTNRLLVVSAKEISAALSPSDRDKHQQLQTEVNRFDKLKPAALPVTMALEDASAIAPTTYVLIRGELSHPGDEVEPGMPVILTPGHKTFATPIRPLGEKSTGRRSALAHWLANPNNPLTARVMVNRLWQHHFGRGLVPTPNDFGVRGERPTHPELLDWLATEFVRSGWDIKHMHRLMLTSATYQQATRPTRAALEKDPDNRLFSRMNRLRLEGEVIRDSLLAISGRLNAKMGGPGVFPPIPDEAGAKDWKVSADPADHRRRSVYIFARRNVRFPFLEAFDLPDSNQSCPKRERSTTAPQALALLNSGDVMEAAKGLAVRLQREASSTDQRIARAYQLTLGREPSPRERELAREFLEQSPLSEFCRALLNLNEFVFVD